MSLRDDRDGPRVGEGYWFVPKLFGLGATPVTWQGWAMTIGFAALLIADVRLMPGQLPRIAVGLGLVVLFTVFAWRKTDGGWTWRWGSRQ